MDHWSDNFTAEMVLKTIGYKALGQGTTAAGAAVTKRDLAAGGIPRRGRPDRRRLGPLARRPRDRARARPRCS